MMVPIAATTSTELRQNWVMTGLILRTVTDWSDFCHSAKGAVSVRDRKGQRLLIVISKTTRQAINGQISERAEIGTLST
jgi:hypothetical protein